MEERDDTEGPAEEHLGEEFSDEDQLEPETASSGSDELEKAIAELRAESKENYDKYVRAVAELENYKKRSMKERTDLIKYGGEGLARDILDVVDDLERAMQQTGHSMEETVRVGLEMVLAKFNGVLEKHSIVGESALNAAFNPATHEALASQPSEEHAPGTVIQEYKKAYRFRDKLLRPGQVVVSAAVAPKEGERE